MLSRLALRPEVGLALARATPVQIRVCHHITKDAKDLEYPSTFKEGPERDLVNFPRKTMPIYPGKVRLGFVPDEWFQFFYKKTGVTGPYLFGTGLLTYLLSKELWVMEHDFYTGVSLTILLTIAIKKLGPGVAKYLDKEGDAMDQAWKDIRINNMKSITDGIKSEKKAQWCAQGQKYLIEAKRENILLQLEAEYRNRMMTAYREVKKRLDYQLELQNASRRIEQRHMVKWIVDNVMKSISPQQEKEALTMCVANLKRLAAQPR